MNNMEEKLWAYIDDTCSEEERAVIAGLIEKDATWRAAFNDIIALDTDISLLAPDEPPMAFCYNVMEGIRAHEASKPLKTHVNSYIIGAIAAFFILTIGVMLGMIFSGETTNVSNSLPGVNLPDLSALFNSNLINVFFYVDILLLLFLADAVIRRKVNNATTGSV